MKTLFSNSLESVIQKVRHTGSLEAKAKKNTLKSKRKFRIENLLARAKKVQDKIDLMTAIRANRHKPAIVLS